MSPDASAPACLEIRALWKVFGPKPDQAIEMAEAGRSRDEILSDTGCIVAVRDVSFRVERGETFVVMGLSGSGKSTLIRCVSRLTDASRGQVMLDGEDLTALNEHDLREVRRRKLSMVFQHFGLFPHRRVIDNAAYGLEIQGLKRPERHARAREVLETVGLKGWESHFPQQLSGGMQQRVGLARALCVGPEVLFFDEPFSALDPLIRRDMQDELIRLQAEMRGTLVFITHDFAEAIKLGDRIAIMKDGAFDQIGTAAELITRPATPYVEEFTRDIPKAKVLTAADVMTPGEFGSAEDRTVGASDTVERIVPVLLDGLTALRVIDADGRAVGVVDRATVAELLAAD